MSVLTDLLAYLSGLIRPHLTFVAAALVATLLVIYVITLIAPSGA